MPTKKQIGDLAEKAVAVAEALQKQGYIVEIHPRRSSGSRSGSAKARSGRILRASKIKSHSRQVNF